MSCDCSPCGSNTPTTNIPGSAGQGAYTTTNGAFTIPAANGVTTVDIPVVSTAWMGAGQYLAIPGLVLGQVGIFQVQSFPSASTVRVVYPAFSSNTHAGDVIPSGYAVVASGREISTPVSIVNGGTGSATKALAQTALGLGQDSVNANTSGLTQAITASFVQVGAMAAAIPAAGSYQLRCSVTLDFLGVTFAAVQTISIKLRNATQGVDLGTTTFTVRPITTINYPNFQYAINPILYAAGVAADSIQALITVSVINSAGTLQVTAGNIEMIPLRKS
jgi:hypothetical protein